MGLNWGGGEVFGKPGKISRNWMIKIIKCYIQRKGRAAAAGGGTGGDFAEARSFTNSGLFTAPRDQKRSGRRGGGEWGRGKENSGKSEKNYN